MEKRAVGIVTEEAPSQRHSRAPGEEVLTTVLSLSAECTRVTEGVPASERVKVVRHWSGGDGEIL